ncbi:MAG: rhomboid family intramembrane serine protease [Flavobacteriaceae bacterium]|nr:rhomboid family intramembrane serine protease [Flavobacteriaceae bacterium]
MNPEKSFEISIKTVLLPLILIFIMWWVYWFEITFGYNFNDFGIYPRTLSGLKGILFSPFVHANAQHLFNNSIPLLVLLLVLGYFYQPIATKVLLFGWLGTGIITWLIARPSFHIGASGIVYLLVSFIFFSGIFRKYYRLIAVSLVVIFLYGSMTWYLFPIEKGISFEGHAAGFIIGFTLAILYKNQGPQQEEIVWTKTEFDELFDEEGNLKREQ